MKIVQLQYWMMLLNVNVFLNIGSQSCVSFMQFLFVIYLLSLGFGFIYVSVDCGYVCGFSQGFFKWI